MFLEFSLDRLSTIMINKGKKTMRTIQMESETIWPSFSAYATIVRMNL